MKCLQINILAATLGLCLLNAGCQDHTSPPPPRVQSPPVGQDSPRPQQEMAKPLPGTVLPSYQPQPDPQPLPPEDIRTPVR
jgi:hypothetical protein